MPLIGKGDEHFQPLEHGTSERQPAAKGKGRPCWRGGGVLNGAR
jgi:hypothetical protein